MSIEWGQIKLSNSERKPRNMRRRERIHLRHTTSYQPPTELSQAILDLVRRAPSPVTADELKERWNGLDHGARVCPFVTRT